MTMPNGQATNEDGEGERRTVTPSAGSCAQATGNGCQSTTKSELALPRVPLGRGTTDGPRHPRLDKFRKRGRVESAHYLSSTADVGLNGDADRREANGTTGSVPMQGGGACNGYGPWRAGRQGRRAASMPNLAMSTDHLSHENIFPDVNPRALRIAEVKSWRCSWMDREFPVEKEARSAKQPFKVTKPASPVQTQWHMKQESEELDQMIDQLSTELLHEEKAPSSSAWSEARQTYPSSARVNVASGGSMLSGSSTQTPPHKPKRPQLRLKLEDMPTPQQAEDRAQRAANKLLARRDAIERAMSSASSESENRSSATQKAMLRLNLRSFSSGEDSCPESPSDAGRHSAGSAYSPNHGMFTTKNVAVSEAGISSPDSACLHLQENLQRVKEVGRGASGVVYKAIHIPTLKVVAVKDVPVYGRGQRRQMVRELHALYSNLVPISEKEHGYQKTSEARNARPKASPYIVSFYDAFVDRAKNCICLVMEYMGTGSLQDIVLRGGCQNEMILARLATGILNGLAHIHGKRMVHRDIKPHNLLTNRQGEAKISDFGLARTLNDVNTSTKTFVGTLLYMAPERIGGGDYSYPADIWSFGLALVCVALGRYPLPTQDGFFGLVDSVANEKCLELPADQFSIECRDFAQKCLKIDPAERLTAQELLRHPFLKKFTPEETLAAWTNFIDSSKLSEDRDSELESLADAVYRHMYERYVKFSYQPQSDYGVSFMSHQMPSYSRRIVSIEPVEMSLQLGLSASLGLSVHKVHQQFENKRAQYNEKLMEEFCFSPQSWTASPGVHRRQQLFGSDSDSSREENDSKGSFWRKLQESMKKFSRGKKKKEKEPRKSFRASVL